MSPEEIYKSYKSLTLDLLEDSQRKSDKIASLKAALEIAEKALKSCDIELDTGYDYKYYDEELVEQALAALANLKEQKTNL